MSMRLWICVVKVYMYIATHIKGACQAVFTCGQIVAAFCAAVKHYSCHVELVHHPSNIIILWSYRSYPQDHFTLRHSLLDGKAHECPLAAVYTAVSGEA